MLSLENDAMTGDAPDGFRAVVAHLPLSVDSDLDPVDGPERANADTPAGR